MRIEWRQALAAAGFAALALGAAAQESFDACGVFTLEDAQKVIGKEAAGEPVNPKAKRPKVIASCTYHAVKDGTKVAATASYKFARTPEEAQRAFDEARMQFQTKPMLIDGADAFWSAKTGEMTLRKGRTWLTVSVGPSQLAQREMNDARRLAEILAKKL
jgi:hypothetical protein